MNVPREEAHVIKNCRYRSNKELRKVIPESLLVLMHSSRPTWNHSASAFQESLANGGRP